jgi:hypothetical protein
MPADVIDDLIRAADPLRDRELPAPGSDEARRAHRTATRQPVRVLRRAVAVGIAAVVGVGAAVGATRDGHPGTSIQVVCSASPVSDAVVGFDVRTDDPVQVCARRWTEFFHEPAPARLSACVDSSAQGSIKVYPGGTNVCADRHADPYTGPTETQRRFAAFLDEAQDLRDRTGDRCLTLEQLRTVVDGLLATHRLTGWTYGRPDSPEPSCATVVGFNEPEKMIITN